MSAPSVHEYARFHRLAIDHASEDLVKYISQLPLRAIEDDHQLSNPDFSTFSDKLAEPKLQLSQQATSLLAESVLDHCPSINWSHFLPDRHRVHNLKIEETLLSGDHQTDVRRFRGEALSHVDTEQFFETCSLISSASGQDFQDEWNDIQSGHARRGVEQELEDERCHTTKEALVQLSASLKDPVSEEMEATILNSFGSMLKVRFPISCLSDLTDEAKKPRARSLTPVLMSESPGPRVLSPPDLDFSLRSDEDVDLDSLLLQLEMEMEDKDQIPFDGVSNGSLTMAEGIVDATKLEIEEDLRIETICAPVAEYHRERRGLESLRLDVPMVPSSSQFEQPSEQAAILSPPAEPGQPDRACLFTRTAPRSPIVEIQPNLTTTECTVDTSNLGSLEDLLSSTTVKSENVGFEAKQQDDLDEDLIKLADKAAKETDTWLRRDKISIPEECLKQSVPQLKQFSVMSSHNGQGAEFLMGKLVEMCLINPQTGNLQNEMKLNWSPFPSRFIKLDLVDSIQDDGKLHSFLDPPQAITKSEQMLWKRPGLRILDTNYESDGEIEEDSELAEPIVPAKRPKHGLDSPCTSPTKKSCMLETNGIPNSLGYKNSQALNVFSTSNALATFLDLRGGKFKRVAQLQLPSVNELADDPIQPTQSEEDGQISPARSLVLKPSGALAELNPSIIQVPSTPTETVFAGGNYEVYPLMELKWPRTILIETGILARYPSLISFLETNGGTQLNMIYREMSQSNRDPPLSASPDMILNPTTALIFTTLQALNQKGLPGQGIEAGQAMVQSRILRLGYDYTQLFVLVTTLGPEGSMLQSQIDTMTIFVGFCANACYRYGLRVHPIWVFSKHGGRSVETALSKWIWNLACRHGFPETYPCQSLHPKIDTVTISNEETLWEQFLKKAGLNPMAAQVVLGGLRRADPPDTTFDQNWGLRRFVEMHPDERRDMFAEILGRRVVERINAVLEKDWG
ncbi:uncharacterized protein Z519_05526 [Cladophialophora bantiana CBS 173.52]|uniref:Uncharacterized protein n=1 Tax=Cladophialophora bantiana (strain ATCC 10958 / CBS 173.52 / CDC B-1940 / NIH 8579) TaxID=1442370 RepID=A0A0D2HTN2_CLAB1|nr:uncharacterized protein Z519_05526 [Cladophialophora bantiana CBS 173.52]KIW94210.1 hypothetical protein Z519_05526 [Cladophialophora bantiana CBS 173.52]